MYVFPLYKKNCIPLALDLQTGAYCIFAKGQQLHSTSLLCETKFSCNFTLWVRWVHGTCCFVVSLRVVAENVVTDRRKERHTYKPSTITLAIIHVYKWKNHFFKTKGGYRDGLKHQNGRNKGLLHSKVAQNYMTPSLYLCSIFNFAYI